MEHGVVHSERWILAALRNHKFFSVDVANLVIAEKLENLNNKPFQKMDGCRTSWFLEIDKPALEQLPETRYEFRQWKKVTVPMDYHVEFDKKFYSLPYKLFSKTVEILATQNTIEIYHKGQRVAIHRRSNGPEPHLTHPTHMPASHRAYAARTRKKWFYGPPRWVHRRKNGHGACLVLALI